MESIKFNQFVEITIVRKSQTESIHQQTLRKKQPLGAQKYPIESVYLDERWFKIKK